MTKIFIPVIHVLNMEQVMRNLELVILNGADGVFLINHGPINYKNLIVIYNKAVETYPNFWIGLNCLDLPSHKIFDILPNDIDGIWADDGGVYDEDISYAKMISKYRKKSSFKGLYFGGVSFKGHYVEYPDKVAKLSKKYVDIITTSGCRTGKPACLSKIVSMKNAIGERSLGVASGISINNVKDYLPYVDYFIVATGISRSFYELEPYKVKDLAKVIHEY